MISYRCNAQVEDGNKCSRCGEDLSILVKAHKLSKAYYDEALKMAKVRNLSGAVAGLRKSLKFDKYNKDARNLLGLVLYEMGDTL